MNGLHDMGGMHGLGPIQHEKSEPTFHEAWEGRVYAISRAMGQSRVWNIDASRHHIELLRPADYLRMSYYEKWLERVIALLKNRGLATHTEIETGLSAPGSAKVTPALSAVEVPAMAECRGNFMRPEADASARFALGQRVRAKNLNPVGHTRLPRYARSKQGAIAHHYGIFVFPDTNAHFLGEQPQHLYSVRFAARELWGEEASPRDSVYIDLWDSYLDHA